MLLPVEGQDSTCLLNLPLQFISKEHDLKAFKQQLDKNLKTNSASRFKNGDKKEKKTRMSSAKLFALHANAKRENKRSVTT